MCKIKQALGKDGIKDLQLNLFDSNHTTIHVRNSEYQILELVDELREVHIDNWLWVCFSV